MWPYWLVLAGVCFVIEIYTVGFFVFWFGIGALIALIVSLFSNNLILQAVCFVVSSSLLLLLTKPLAKKIMKNTNSNPTNVYSVVGQEGIVLEDIDSISGHGSVKIKGELWSATSDEPIKKDSKVKVISINGVKAKVEKI